MKINDLFVRDINRPVPPVIMAGQQDEQNVLRELDEYVVTRELDRELRRVFEHYAASLERPTERIGVWISGFFGSGKSHFLKILSYLLSNREVQGKKAISYFDEEKLPDAMLRATLDRAGRAAQQADVILFNIDAKADSGSKTNKEAVARVMLKALDDHLGYLGSSPELAAFERLLDKRGRYDAFKAAFEQEAGQPWTDLRDGWELEQGHIIAALKTAVGMEENEAERLLDSVRNKSDVSAEEFAREVKDYLTRRGAGHRILFLVDEVGQYVGDNSNLMLNLQSVTEELGAKAPGQAWILVTSQEDIDSVLSGKGKSNDFSKIQGRFSTQVKLSSANTDEVIRLRLLQKNPDGEQALRALYDRVQAPLKNQVTFRNDFTLPSFKTAEDFVGTYPFIPYQFLLLQKVFEAIRTTGYSGKSLSEGERSMLSAFQEAARVASNQELGALVPFHAFYHSVEGFLDSNVRRVIDQAQDNPALERQDIDLLRTLFMLKHVKEIHTNVDNLVTLALTHVDANKMELRGEIEASLARLEKQTLIQFAGQQWVFLTNEEQDVGKEIKNVEVSEGELNNELQKRVWNSIFIPTNFKFDAYRTYPFNKRLDDRTHGAATGDIGLHVVTPYSERFAELAEDHLAALKSAAQSGEAIEALLVLPDERSLFDELTEMVKTDKYVSRKSGQDNTPSMRLILQARQEENAQRKARIETKLEQALTAARVYALGSRQQPSGARASEVMQNTLRLLVENGFPKRSYINKPHLTEQDITRALTNVDDSQNLDGKDPNHLALDEMERFLQYQQTRGLRVTVTDLLGRFTKLPYGWMPAEALGILGTLVAKGQAELQVAQKTVDPGEHGLANKLLKKAGQDQTVVRVSDAIDIGALNAARQLGKDYLEKLNNGVPAEAPALVTAYRAQFAEDQRELDGYLSKAEQGYPFSPALGEPHALITELLGIQSTAALIGAIKTRRDDLEDYLDLREKLRNFYKGTQVKIFDELRQGLRELDADLSRVNRTDLLERLQKARQVTQSPDPVKDIAGMAGHLKPVLAYVEDLLQEAKARVREVLESEVKRLQAIALELGPEETSKLTQPILDVRGRLDSAKTIDAAESTQLAVQQAAHKVEQDIIRAINARAEAEKRRQEESRRKEEERKRKEQEGNKATGKEEPEPEPHPEPEPEPVIVTRPIRTIEVKKVSSKTYLETQGDIQEFLTTLKQQLEQAVQSGERVRLE
ncbi:BREX system P-loop protein BrxC [Deinococcus antarcticus]|uniref:BREX system P-loop protein BrxC n=1 Tax=Deinococcus antarcticus TaxID=1298767 RepID=A0ABV8A656_9DEIO